MVWQHGSHHFGVLVCSELSNIGTASRYRGHVDSLFVASWNRDLETFASLLDAIAFENHCFAILANERRYGDSRIRGPFKKRYMRDMVRVRGGLDDYVVGALIRLADLRNAHHRQDPAGIFLPLPDGFRPSSARPRI